MQNSKQDGAQYMSLGRCRKGVGLDIASHYFCPRCASSRTSPELYLLASLPQLGERKVPSAGNNSLYFICRARYLASCASHASSASHARCVSHRRSASPLAITHGLDTYPRPRTGFQALHSRKGKGAVAVEIVHGVDSHGTV